MKCIIVDDDSMSINALETLVNQTDVLELIGSFNSSISALSFLNSNRVDLVFLDIEMPDMTGLEILANLKTQPLVIFTTGSSQYSLAAFDFIAVYYLIKPITAPKFFKAVFKARELHNKRVAEERIKDFIFIKAEGVFYKTFFKDILFIESLGDYITVYTKERKMTMYSTLKGLAPKLPSFFLRVHRSYVVNINFLDNIEDNTISLKGNLIPIGTSYKTDVYNRLNLL